MGSGAVNCECPVPLAASRRGGLPVPKAWLSCSLGLNVSCCPACSPEHGLAKHCLLHGISDTGGLLAAGVTQLPVRVHGKQP